MELYRLSRKKYKDVLSGKGAALRGARWNSKGTEIIYTASNRSLAMAEVSVHMTMATVPNDYYMITIYAPDNISTKHLNYDDLPVNWNQFPHIRDTQIFGDDFILNNQECILKIPSAVTKNDYNILINPFHVEFKKIKIVDTEEFPFDKRIFA